MRKIWKTKSADTPIIATIAGMLLWGFTVGQAYTAHTLLRIPLKDLPETLRGLRIVQTSDLHIGNRMEGRRLQRLVARVNSLDPDLVVVTGDIFDFDPSVLEEGARSLAGLRARYGVFAVLGNHDTYVGSEEVAAAIRDHAPAIRLLRKETVRLPLPKPLYLAGIDDPGQEWTAREVDLPDLEELAEDNVLTINPIIYAEVSIGFSRIEDLDAALAPEAFEREPLPWPAGFLS